MNTKIKLLAAIAVVGASIVPAQAETGFNPFEDTAGRFSTEITASVDQSTEYRTNDGHNF